MTGKKSIKFYLDPDQHQLLQVFSWNRKIPMAKMLRMAVKAITDIQVRQWQAEENKPVQEAVKKVDWAHEDRRKLKMEVNKIFRDLKKQTPGEIQQAIAQEFEGKT